MAIYRIRTNNEEYMLFNLTPTELRAKMGRGFRYNINRLPTSQPDWVMPDAIFRKSPNFKKADKLPDISFWTTSHMVLNQKAYDVLASQLKEYGEFLPVSIEGITYYIFNVLYLVDESFIDLDKSEREYEGEGDCRAQVGLHKLKFKEELLSNTLLFKTEFDTYLNIFCGDEFKDLVENAGLQGIVFKPDLASVF